MSPCAIVFVAIRPKVPSLAQEVEGPPEEVRDEVGVAVALLVQMLAASPE